VIIRDALPDELPEVGELRVAAYVAGGFLSESSGYEPRLRALWTDGQGSVLVAVTKDADACPPERAPAAEAAEQPAADAADLPEAEAADPLKLTGQPASEGRIVGTIMVRAAAEAGPVVTGPDEAEIRALAVAPGAQGKGIGRSLLLAVIDWAAQRGVRHLVLSTEPEMRAAQHLYEQAGFRRLPDRDWCTEHGGELVAYGLRLDEPTLTPGRPQPV
jgi:ribosomal protein S18 acetylase RimI-like enzyme